MPLSTVLGAQSLVQPAVCTTATRPASPYTGQAIYDTTVATTLVWSGSAWIGASGKVLQVVQGTSVTQVNSTSTSFVTTGLAVTITPTSNTSSVLVLCSTSGVNTTGSQDVMFTLFRGTVAGTNLGDANSGFVVMYPANYAGVAFHYLDAPATTSATTYTMGMRIAAAGPTVRAQSASARGTIIAMEVSA